MGKKRMKKGMKGEKWFSEFLSKTTRLIVHNTKEKAKNGSNSKDTKIKLG